MRKKVSTCGVKSLIMIFKIMNNSIFNSYGFNKLAHIFSESFLDIRL